MAGAGYRTFTAGQVLTAAQVQTYLQDQSVMVFDSAAARSSALGTSVAEGMVTYLKDTNAVEYYDSSAWKNVGDKAILKSDFTAAGQIIYSSGSGVPAYLSGGSAGQVLLSGGTNVYWGSLAPTGGASYYYKSTGGTVVQTFGTGIYNIQFTGGGSLLFGGSAYAQGSYLVEYTNEPGTVVLPSQLGLSWATATTTNPVGQADFAFGANVFVGAAFNTYSSYSTDGITWSTVAQGTATMRSVAFGNNLFTLVGDNGTIRVSTDGLTWSSRTSGITTVLSNVLFLNGNFVIITDSTTLLHSTDTITWTSRTLTGYAYGYSAAYGNNTYVVQGNDSGGNIKVWTSSDLVTWTSRVAGTSSYNSYLVTFFNNKFIIFYQNANSYSSTDGITWSSLTTPSPTVPGWQAANVNGILYYTTNSSSTELLRASTDGVTFTKITTLTSANQARALVFGQNKVILGTTGNDIFRSEASNVYAALEQKLPLTTV